LLIRILLVLSYISWCFRFLIGPWKYFQLNANYFNEDKELFSKLDMDLLIPRKWRSDNSSAIISVVETCNRSDDNMPINGINNSDTFYRSCTDELSEDQIKKIEMLFSHIGDFKIARYCARADSLEALLEEQFSIVEINVFVPMPLMLLADNLGFKTKLTFILATMRQLALVTKDIPPSQEIKSVFFKKLHSARLLKACAKHGLYNEH